MFPELEDGEVDYVIATARVVLQCKLN